VGNWFHKTCVEAEAGINAFNMTTLLWDVHPDRDQLWFEKETQNMSTRQIAQELECNFNVSGETVIHPDDLAHYMKTSKEPKYRTGFDRNYWIWEEYQDGAPYLLSADIARGDGQDNSAFHVFKLDTMEIVAEYIGKPNPDDYADILYDAGKEYGSCMIVAENNNIGFAVLNKLKDKGYNNVYHSTKSSHEYVDPIQAQWQSNIVPGFTTSSKTRPLVIAKMEEFMRNKLIKINSNRLLSEMKTFIWHNGRAQAMRSYNDDLIMSFAIGCWVRDTVLVENQKMSEYNKSALLSMSTSTRKMNTTIPGMVGHKRSTTETRLEKAIKFNEQYAAIIKG
jgi:hypothetical protein